MDSDSLSPRLDHLEVPKNQQASKKRKIVEKTVVTVKIGTTALGKLKNEGPPSDSWSWRKYGQKPIKGSPHPRGYYRCSTSKGCSAKKQVERCKYDDSMLIITYTSSHNHPGPDDDTQDHDDHDNLDDHHTKPQEITQPPPPPPTTTITQGNNDHQDNKKECGSFEYIDEALVEYCPRENNIESSGVELDQQDTFTSTTSSTTSGTNDNAYVLDDFFDELEELPTYSNFKSVIRTHLSDEINIRNNNIPIVPS